MALGSFHPSKEVFEAVIKEIKQQKQAVSIPLRKFLRFVPHGDLLTVIFVSIPLRKFLRDDPQLTRVNYLTSFHPSKEVFEVGVRSFTDFGF